MPSATASAFSPDTLPDLTGRVYLVTGGNTGIGKATVIGLASRGAKVYIGARSEEKAMAAIEEIKAELELPLAQLSFLPLDLSKLSSVVSAANKLRDEETSLHGLVNNAGIMGVPYSVTEDGFELQFQTNYLSHWLLTWHLLPILHATAANSPDNAVRIVNVTSDGHERFAPKKGIVFQDIALEKESAMTRYGQSKLANILHAKQLHRLFGPDGEKTSGSGTSPICMGAVHPGHIDTNLNKQATGTAPSSVLRAITPVMRCLGILDDQAKGAWSSLFVVASREFGAADSGSYVVPYAKIGKPSAMAVDEELARRLWEWTEGELGSRGLLTSLGESS